MRGGYLSSLGIHMGDPTNRNSADAAVFNRGAINMTFELIRPINPSLALTVRNILSTPPLPKPASEIDNKLSDQFRIDLDSFQVRYVVEALMEYQNPNNTYDKGKIAVSKALVQDWLALAKQMIDALPDNQNPFK